MKNSRPSAIHIPAEPPKSILGIVGGTARRLGKAMLPAALLGAMNSTGMPGFGRPRYLGPDSGDFGRSEACRRLRHRNRLRRLGIGRQ